MRHTCGAEALRWLRSMVVLEARATCMQQSTLRTRHQVGARHTGHAEPDGGAISRGRLYMRRPPRRPIGPREVATKSANAMAARAPSDHLYWARTKSNAAPVEHTPLTADEAASLAQQNRANVNAAWEEKDVSKWAHELLREQLVAGVVGTVAGAESATARVTEVISCKGDVTYVLSRGKQRAVFELALKLKVEVEVREGDELREILTGEMHVPELANDDLSAKALPAAKLRCEQAAGARAFEGGCRAMWPSMVEALQSLVEQTKQRWGGA